MHNFGRKVSNTKQNLVCFKGLKKEKKFVIQVNLIFCLNFSIFKVHGKLDSYRSNEENEISK